MADELKRRISDRVNGSPTVLAESVTFTGDLVVPGALVLSGSVKGDGEIGGTLSIADTTMTGNTGRYWTQAQSGNITNAGTAVGTNCRSITITNSTIQGVP